MLAKNLMKWIINACKCRDSETNTHTIQLKGLAKQSNKGAAIDKTITILKQAIICVVQAINAILPARKAHFLCVCVCLCACVNNKIKFKCRSVKFACNPKFSFFVFVLHVPFLTFGSWFRPAFFVLFSFNDCFHFLLFFFISTLWNI